MQVLLNHIFSVLIAVIPSILFLRIIISYVGLYLICAFLGLHSAAIRKLDGNSFFKWICSATVGGSLTQTSPWIQLLPLDDGILLTAPNVKMDFSNFTRAWIHAADGTVNIIIL